MRTEQLWGGSLVGLSLDVPNQTATLTVTVTQGDGSQRHELRLTGVAEFRFFNGIESPWDYAEITEIHFEKEASTGRWAFDVVLWSDDAGLTGSCASATLDGLELEQSK